MPSTRYGTEYYPSIFTQTLIVASTVYTAQKLTEPLEYQPQILAHENGCGMAGLEFDVLRASDESCVTDVEFNWSSRTD